MVPHFSGNSGYCLFLTWRFPIIPPQEQYLTTILERTETNTLETLERVRRARAQQRESQVPVHARVVVRDHKLLTSPEASATEDTASEYSHATELYSEQEIEVESRPMRNFAIISEEVAAEEQGDYVLQTGGTLTRSSAAAAGAAAVSRTSRSSREEVLRRRRMSSEAAANLSNFDVLFRIVTVTDDYAGGASAGGDTSADEISSIFTSDERQAIRRALQQDHQLQTELRSTFHREEFRQLLSS